MLSVRVRVRLPTNFNEVGVNLQLQLIIKRVCGNCPPGRPNTICTLCREIAALKSFLDQQPRSVSHTLYSSDLSLLKEKESPRYPLL